MTDEDESSDLDEDFLRLAEVDSPDWNWRLFHSTPDFDLFMLCAAGTNCHFAFNNKSILLIMESKSLIATLNNTFLIYSTVTD